jgi:hypothetical protein
LSETINTSTMLSPFTSSMSNLNLLLSGFFHSFKTKCSHIFISWTYHYLNQYTHKDICECECEWTNCSMWCCTHQQLIRVKNHHYLLWNETTDHTICLVRKLFAHFISPKISSPFVLTKQIILFFCSFVGWLVCLFEDLLSVWNLLCVC